MSNLLRKLTSRGLSFSHLAKVDPLAAEETPEPNDKGGKKGKAENDDPDNQNTENGDSNGKKGKKADDDNPPPEDPNNKGKKGRVSEENPDPNAEGDDDDDEEMRGNSTAAQARRRERARCASIMGSQHAGRNPVLAANLAFGSTMSRADAIAILKDTPTAASATPVSRSNPVLGAGGEASVTSAQAVSASWDRAMQKARPASKQR